MSMRLPTISQFKAQVAQMTQQYARITTLQTQIATGKKLQQSSDDPLLASRIKSITDYIERLDGYEINTTLAENRLSIASSAIQQSVDLGMKAQELLIRAQNGTMNNNDRQNIALELQGILSRFVAVANTQDSNGEYIFNGFLVGSSAYTQQGSQFQYQGSYQGYSIPIGDQAEVLYNDSGFRVFGEIKSGNGFYSVVSDIANNTGTGVIDPVTVLNTASTIPEDYTVTMVTNASGKVGYQVVGSISGQVIPALPLTLPADAPEYVAGADIVFNGISTRISGAVGQGDTFSIKQSVSQSIFQTLQNAIDVLKTPVVSDKNRADLTQVMGEQSSSLSTALSHLISQLTEAGDRAKTIDDQIKINKNKSIDEQVLLSALANADLTRSISDLSQQLTSLNITQQSYLKIQETFAQLLRQ